jgi:hypothetical protein
MDNTKPFCISKREVWEAYKRVKANQGAAGVDGQSIEQFEEDLENNLYRLWNRMCSGSYFPPPVRRVDIPKGDGQTRPLGIPTVSDRIAQMVVQRYLEPIVEPLFHDDSYGYRAGRSAHQALSVARQRCWRYDWVLGRFHASALRRALRTLDDFLVRWAQRKYKRFRAHKKRAWQWLWRVRARQPDLFAHWALASTVGR